MAAERPWLQVVPEKCKFEDCVEYHGSTARPSLAPTISLLGYILGQLLSATVVVEIVFNLPGMGTALVVEGVLLRDYPLVQGIILIFALIVVVVSFLSDTVSGWLDPRTRVS